MTELITKVTETIIISGAIAIGTYAVIIITVMTINHTLDNIERRND